MFTDPHDIGYEIGLVFSKEAQGGFLEQVGSFWKGLAPQTQHAIIGGGAGTLLGGLLGGGKGAIAGGLGGAGAGYFGSPYIQEWLKSQPQKQPVPGAGAQPVAQITAPQQQQEQADLAGSQVMKPALDPNRPWYQRFGEKADPPAARAAQARAAERIQRMPSVNNTGNTLSGDVIALPLSQRTDLPVFREMTAQVATGKVNKNHPMWQRYTGVTAHGGGERGYEVDSPPVTPVAVTYLDRDTGKAYVENRQWGRVELGPIYRDKTTGAPHSPIKRMQFEGIINLGTTTEFIGKEQGIPFLMAQRPLRNTVQEQFKIVRDLDSGKVYAYKARRPVSFGSEQEQAVAISGIAEIDAPLLRRRGMTAYEKYPHWVPYTQKSYLTNAVFGRQK